MALVIMAAAAVFGFAGEAEEEQPLTGHLVLENVKTGEKYSYRQADKTNEASCKAA